MGENEIVLLRRFVENGDAEAFSEIVRRHAGLVYGSCLRILNDRTSAADAVQETFTQLLRDAAKVTESVPCWLHRVATRKSVDLIRRDSRRRRREARYAAGKMIDTPQWEDVSLYIDEALDELDSETREILIRHFFEGHTTKEIAAELAISQPTASRRIDSGVTRLRTKLHNRGILTAVGALSSLLVGNAAEAAPAVVMKELGKIALAGAKAAAASSAAGVSTAASVAGKATTGAVVTTVKAKIVTVAAVALAGVGGAVTYKYVAGTAAQPPTRNPSVTATTPRRETVNSAHVTTRGPTVPSVRRTPPQPDEAAAAGNETQPRGTTAAPVENSADTKVVTPGGYGMVRTRSRKGRTPGSSGGRYGGYYYSRRPLEPQEDPNKSDSNSEGKTMVTLRAK